MIKWTSVLALAAVVLSGCVSFPEEKPVYTGYVRGNYVSVADCSFLQLQQKFGQINRIELPSQKSIQLSQGDHELVRWRMDIADASDGRSHLTFRSGRAVWGVNHYLDQVMPSVRSCAPE